MISAVNSYSNTLSYTIAIDRYHNVLGSLNFHAINLEISSGTGHKATSDRQFFTCLYAHSVNQLVTVNPWHLRYAHNTGGSNPLLEINVFNYKLYIL